MAFWGICILNEIPSVPTTFSCSITWITLCSSLETIFFSREIRETTNWKHILELFGDPWKSTMPIMLLPGDTWLFCTHNFAISPFASLILAWIGGFFAELEICSKKLRKASVLLASNDLRYSLHNGWYSLAWKGGNCKWNIPLFNKSRICRVSHKSKVTRALGASNRLFLNRGQKMALTAFYFIITLTDYYMKRSQRHLLAATLHTSPEWNRSVQKT